MIFNLIFVFLASISGLCLGLIGFRNYKNINVSVEEVSILRVIKISTYFGLAGSLTFLVIIVLASIFDEKYIWTLEKFVGAILMSLIPGLVITFGSMYQIYTTVKYRDLLTKSYKEKARQKQK